MRTGITARGTLMVQQMATAQMLQSCVVEDVVAPGVDPNSLKASAGSRTTIYSGICRIWEQENPSQILMGETEFVAYQTVFSIPWDTPLANVPKLHNEVQITASPTDATWVGARFRIQTLKQGGQILATRSYVVERLEPRP